MRERILSTIVPPIVFGVVLLGSAPFADAQVTSLPINKCLAGKIKGVGKSLAARTGCFSKEASAGFDDPNCPQKASDKFTGGSDLSRGVFTKLERKYAIAATTPCLTFDDQGAFESDLTTYAASIPAATGNATGKCDAAKIKCVSKYVAAVGNCDAKAAGKDGSIDTNCTGKAAGKLANGASGCLDRAAQHPGCMHAGNQAVALQWAADQFIQDALCALDPGNGGCLCTPHSSGTYTDNCDGMVSDSATGLMWEKKTTAVGSGVNYADPHDVDNYYTWSDGRTSPVLPDGTAFTDFLIKLNTPPCFAGHCDWRLPSEEGRNSPYTGAKELESILLSPYPCGTSPCIDTIFGPTGADYFDYSYWSSTTYEDDPKGAWGVEFYSGDMCIPFTDDNGYVRAVRTGP